MKFLAQINVVGFPEMETKPIVALCKYWRFD